MTLRVLLLVAVLMCALGCAYLIARPRLANDRHGDARLLDLIGEPDGLNAIAVVLVEKGRPARYAGLGADEHRPFEIGSNTKTFTGLLLAEAVRRGEVRLDDHLGRWLDLGRAPAADVTLAELATHRSGLPRDGAHAGQTLCWVIGSNCVGLSMADFLGDLAAAELTDRGTYSYSNLGTAALGHALARAAGTTYVHLVERITTPLGMTATRVQSPETGPLVERGHQPWGLRPATWLMDGYQPTGGLVSDAADLGSYLSALLERRAPGMVALDPIASMPDPGVGDIVDEEIGLLWAAGRLSGHHVRFHTGETAGYRSALMIDLETGRGVAVLSNVNSPVGGIAERLLLED